MYNFITKTKSYNYHIVLSNIVDKITILLITLQFRYAGHP